MATHPVGRLQQPSTPARLGQAMAGNEEIVPIRWYLLAGVQISNLCQDNGGGGRTMNTKLKTRLQKLERQYGASGHTEEKVQQRMARAVLKTLSDAELDALEQ